MTEKKKEEIRVEDRRHFDKEGNPVAGKEAASGPAAPTEQPPEREPKIDFIAVLFSYVHTALIYLGEAADPNEQAGGENLEGAKQMIDILDLMQEKTRGNLTKQEEQYLESALYDLRMRFMKRAKLIK